MRKVFLKHSLLTKFRLAEIDIRSIEKYIWLIEHQSSTDRARQIQTKFFIVISISWAKNSIDRKFGKLKFLKDRAILCRNFPKHNISWMKCMSMRLKVFQKHLNSTQIFKKQVFQPICSQNSNIEHILYQNQGTYNLGWPKLIHTSYHVLSLEKNNLCSVCN